MFWTPKNTFLLKEFCLNIFQKKLTQKLQSQKLLTLGPEQLLSIKRYRLLVGSSVFPIYDLLMPMPYSMG
jgi:hypothetical protein